MVMLPHVNRLLVFTGLTTISLLAVITWLHIKPLGIIFLLIYITWLCKTRSTFKILMPEELTPKLNEVSDFLQQQRNENPTRFCTFSSILLIFLAIVGSFVSGWTVILLSLVMAVLMSSKYNMKILWLKKTNLKPVSREPDNEIDDFLPEINDSMMCYLEYASDQSNTSFITDEAEDKSEEVPSDLLIHESIPEIDENSSDENDDLEFGVGITGTNHLQQKEPSEIDFIKSHFKNDSLASISASTSSSLEEESIQYNYNANSASSNPSLDNPIAISSNLLPAFISGITSWARNATKSDTLEVYEPAVSEDDESDFEIVRTEEYE